MEDRKIRKGLPPGAANIIVAVVILAALVLWKAHSDHPAAKAPAKKGPTAVIVVTRDTPAKVAAPADKKPGAKTPRKRDDHSYTGPFGR